MKASSTSNPRRFPTAPAALAAFLLAGCSLGHNMKTVETVPKDKKRVTGGATIWLTKGDAFYSDSASLAETGNKSTVVFGPLLFLRFGLMDNVEAGVSLDGMYWPGVGGKIRLTDWMAIDANVKFTVPVWEDNPPLRPFFDASAIFGDASHAYGLKLLSRGVMPGTAGRSDPDAVLFYGFKRGFFFPEVAFMTRHREISVGAGFVF
jgi:hypothetical protein